MQIRNSTLPIAVFVKNEYGPAKLNIKNFKLEKSNNIFLVDSKSHLVVDGVQYFGTKSGEIIEVIPLWKFIWKRNNQIKT